MNRSQGSISGAHGTIFGRGVVLISLAVSTLLLAGCGNLLSSRAEAPVTYVLRPMFAEASAAGCGAPAAPAVVQVTEVVVAPGYATESILASRPGRRLDVYAASRWPAALPTVVESLAVEALHAAGCAAQDARASVAPTHGVRILVRRFDAEYVDEATPPLVKVVLEVTVTRRPDRQVLAVFPVEVDIPATANRMGSIVAAFEAATGQALDRMASAATAAIVSTHAVHPPATPNP